MYVKGERQYRESNGVRGKKFDKIKLYISDSHANDDLLGLVSDTFVCDIFLLSIPKEEIDIMINIHHNLHSRVSILSMNVTIIYHQIILSLRIVWQNK